MKLYFYNKEKKHTSKDSDRLICESVSSYLKSTNHTFTVYRDGEKPYLINKDKSAPCLYTGVTHTDDFLIVGISEKAFGIDCEKNTRIVKNLHSIAEKYFSQSECSYIFEDSTYMNLRFLEIWVKKEAYVKFLGTGIFDMKNHDVFSLKNGFEKIQHDDYIIYIYSPENYGQKG